MEGGAAARGTSDASRGVTACVTCRPTVAPAARVTRAELKTARKGIAGRGVLAQRFGQIGPAPRAHGEAVTRVFSDTHSYDLL